jgi:hypothetical protein
VKVSLNHLRVAIVLLAFWFALGTTSCSDFIPEKSPKVPATPGYLDLRGSIHVHSNRWKRLKNGCGTIDKIQQILSRNLQSVLMKRFAGL